MNDYSRNLYNEQLKWLAVDLDGTIAEPIWPEPGIGALMAENWKKIKEFADANEYRIVIYTSRPWADYENIERWCQDNGIGPRAIICGKLMARHYVDDRNKVL